MSIYRFDQPAFCWREISKHVFVADKDDGALVGYVFFHIGHSDGIAQRNDVLSRAFWGWNKHIQNDVRIVALA